MKILFDQNISFRVVNLISEFYPDAKHVKDFGLEFSTDKQIWDFAKTNGFAIITLDSDFNSLLTLFGFPPKIIWLRIGNMSSSFQKELLLKHSLSIAEFLLDSNGQGCLEIYKLNNP